MCMLCHVYTMFLDYISIAAQQYSLVNMLTISIGRESGGYLIGWKMGISKKTPL